MTQDYSKILRLAGPILVGQLGSIATGFADNIMVGRYSTDALAGASFCNSLFALVLMCCLGFTYGVTPLVGARFTQNDTTGIGSVVRNAVVLNTLWCLAIMAVMMVLYFYLDRLGLPPHLVPLMRPYYILCLISLLPITIFNVYAQWSYAINNTVLPMAIMLAGNVVNVVGNYALIYGNLGMPELGLTGAAVSTLLSRALCPVVLVWAFFALRRYRPYSRAFRHARITRAMQGLVWRTSLPVSLQMTFETGAFTFGAYVCGLLGAIQLAAYQIFFTTGTLGFCVYYSIGSAVSVLVANANGLGDRVGMRRIAGHGYHVMLACMAAASLTFIFGGRYIMGLFTDDPAVLACAVAIIGPLVLYQLGDATQITYANALRGTARVAPMLWIAFVSYVIVGLPSTWLLAMPCGLGFEGVALSYSVSLFTAGLLFYAFFRRATRPQCSLCEHHNATL